jgi:hypothetical protein
MTNLSIPQVEKLISMIWVGKINIIPQEKLEEFLYEIYSNNAFFLCGRLKRKSTAMVITSQLLRLRQVSIQPRQGVGVLKEQSLTRGVGISLKIII